MIDNGIKMGEPIIDEVTDEAFGKIIDNMMQTPEQLEKAEKVGEVIAIGSELTREMILKDLPMEPTKEPKYEVQQPVSAQSYQKMTPEQKKLHFPVNRAMRRKQGIR